MFNSSQNKKKPYRKDNSTIPIMHFKKAKDGLVAFFNKATDTKDLSDVQTREVQTVGVGVMISSMAEEAVQANEAARGGYKSDIVRVIEHATFEEDIDNVVNYETKKHESELRASSMQQHFESLLQQDQQAHDELSRLNE